MPGLPVQDGQVTDVKVLPSGTRIVRIKQQASENAGQAKSTATLVRGTAIQKETWELVKKSVAVLPDALGRPFGLAVLIDERGYFLAHSSAIVSEPLTAALDDGSTVRLGRLGYDRTTQLVLLGAQNWTQTSRSSISVSDPDYPAADTTMITVDGPVRSTVADRDVPGMVQTTNRYLPLTEVQFESLASPIGGALVFNRTGQLLGVLGATIQKASDFATTVPNNSFGPQGMTVGYALSPKILRRVVNGFLAPDHKVHHPNIGVLFKDNPIQGAIITEVSANSPAASAGIQKGDLVQKFDGQPVKNALDFATKLFNKDPGETIELNIERLGRPMKIKLVVQGIDLSAMSPGR